jgi:hypothetical protein
MMQTARLFEVITLLLILAMAASCATSNEYVNKIFKPRNAPVEEVAKKEPRAVKFLEFDSTEEETESWAKTWVKGDSTFITKPVVKIDSIIVARSEIKKDTAVSPAKPESIPEEPVARTGNTGGVRSKSKRE